MRTSFIRKVAVGELLFLVTSLFSPLAEANLWQDRRAAQDKSRPVQVASAMTIGSQISSQLPAAVPMSLRKLDALAMPATQSEGTTTAALAAIPQDRILIRDVIDAGAAAPLVVLIQDVHLNPEAQSNISEALVRLLSVGAVTRVGVEGAFDAFDFSLLDGFSDRKLITGVAKDFVDANLMGAPSFAGIAVPGAGRAIVGVDDKANYDLNVAAYRAAQAQQQPLESALSRVKARLGAQKVRHFTPALTSLDGLVESQDKGDASLGVLLKRLADTAGEAPPAILNFLEAFDMEQRLDFPRVEVERRSVVERLAAAMSPDELRSLLESTIAFRSGRVGLAAFHSDLRALCRKKGIDLSAFPAFDTYVRYTLLADGIRADALESARLALEQKAFARLAVTPEQRMLVAASSNFRLIEKLKNFALAPNEWERFQAEKITIAGLQTALAGLDGEKAGAGASPDLADFGNFYRYAEKRSETIVSRLLNGTKSMALVVGGFHTPEISALLKKRGCSVVVCSPRLTKVDLAGGSAYLTVFTREKAPLEKLFLGEKLFVNPTTTNIGPNPALAVRVTAEGAMRAREENSPGSLPAGVKVTRNGPIVRIVLRGIEVFMSGLSRVPGYRLIGTRTGRAGGQFVEEPVLHGRMGNWIALLRSVRWVRWILGAFGLESKGEIAADGLRYVSESRARAFAEAMSSIYALADESGMKDTKIVDVLQAIGDPTFELDKIFPDQPRVRDWIIRMRTNFSDMAKFVSFEPSSQWAPVDVLFDAAGDAIVLEGQSKAGKGSLTKALYDESRDRKLKVGGEDFTVLFFVGGFAFAAPWILRPEDGFQARAYGPRGPVESVRRVGLVKAFVELENTAERTIPVEMAGAEVSEKTAESMTDRNDYPNAPRMKFVRPIKILKVTHSLKSPAEYASLAKELQSRLREVRPKSASLAESFRAATLNAGQSVVDTFTAKAFLVRTAGVVIIGLSAGLVAGLLVGASLGVTVALSVAGLLAAVFLGIFFLAVLRRPDVIGMNRAVAEKPATNVPGVARFLMGPVIDNNAVSVFYRSTDDRVRFDENGRVAQANEDGLVVMELAARQDGKIVSDAPEGATVIHLRSEDPSGRVLLGHVVVKPLDRHTLAIADAMRAFRAQAEARGFPAPGVTVNWNPKLATTATDGKRLLTADLRASIRMAGSPTFRFKILAIEERTGRLSTVVGRTDSVRASVLARSTFPLMTWNRNAWDEGRQTPLTRAFNGLIWAIPGAMSALFVPTGLAPLLAVVTLIVIVALSTVLLPATSRDPARDGLPLLAPSESKSLPTEADALALDFLVLAPTAGEGQRLEDMIRETFLQGYLDRVIYINDGEQPVKRDGVVKPHDLPRLLSIKANGLPKLTDAQKASGLKELTPEQNELLKQQLHFVSFAENQRKEAAVRSTLIFLSTQFHGRLPKVTLIQDSDSFLEGEGVRDQLQAGASQLLGSPHVAMGVPIDGDLNRSSGLIAWGEALVWWLTGGIRSVFFFLDRFALVRKVLSRSVPGGAAFIRTDRLMAALDRHSGTFEAGDLELSQLLVEADREEDPNAKPIADVFTKVRLRTDLMTTAPEVLTQKSRWVGALFDKDPATFIGLFTMIAWTSVYLLATTPLWLVGGMGLIALAPAVMARALNGQIRTMSALTVLLIGPSAIIAFLSMNFSPLEFLYGAVIAILTILNLLTNPRQRFEMRNPMAWAIAPFLGVLITFHIGGFLRAAWEGIMRRVREPGRFKAPPAVAAAPESITARFSRLVADGARGVKARVGGLFIRGATASQENYITDKAAKDRFIRKMDIEDGLIGVDDPQFSENYTAVKAMTDRILAAAGLNPGEFKFSFVDLQSVNAFVISDHNTVFMNVGLLRRAATEGLPLEAVAFVLAHEIIHIVQAREDKDKGEVAERSWATALTARVDNYADEYDADLRALELLDKAGFSVAPASRLFQLLAADGGDRMGHSHPAMVERVRALDEAVRNPYYSNYFTPLQPFTPEMTAELAGESQRRAYQAKSLKKMSAVQLAGHLSDAQTVHQLLAALARGQHSALANLDTIGIGIVKRAFERRLGQLLGDTLAERAFARLLAMTAYSGFGPEWAGFSINRDRKVEPGSILETTRVPDSEISSQLGILDREDLIALLSMEIPGNDRLDIGEQTVDDRAAQEIYNRTLESILGQRRVKPGTAGAQLLAFMKGTRGGPAEYEETHGSYESMVEVAVERLMAMSPSIEQLVQIAVLVNERHTELLLRRSKFSAGDPSETLRSVQERLMAEIAAKLSAAGGTASPDTGARLVDLVNTIPSGSKVKDGDTDMKAIAQALHAEAGRNPAFRDLFVARLRDGAVNGAMRALLAEIESQLTGPGVLVQAESFAQGITGFVAVFNRWALNREIIERLAARFSKDIDGPALIAGLTDVFASGSFKRILDERDDTLMFDAIAMNLLRAFAAKAGSDLWIDAEIDRIASRTKIPELRALPQKMKLLVILHESGGLLSPDDMLDAIGSGVTTSAMTPTLLYLRSLNGRLRQSSRLANGVFHARNWDEYIVRLGVAALNLSLGQPVTMERQRVNNTYSANDAYEAFPGEMASGGREGFAEWRDGSAGVFGVFGSPYIGYMIDRSRQKKPFYVTRLNMTSVAPDVFLAQFDYLFRSGKPFGEVVELLKKFIPPSAYRNHALYAALNALVLAPRGIVLSPSDRFDPKIVLSRVSAVLADGSRSEDAAAIRSAITDLLPLLVSDTLLDQINRKAIVGAVAVDHDVVPADHDQRVAGYPDLGEFQPGGVGSQIDLLLASILRQDLERALPTGAFADARSAVERLYPHPSAIRDRLLDRLTADARASPEDIRGLRPLYADPAARDNSALRGLEAARRAGSTSGEFATLEGEVDQVIRFFPDKSVMRDEIFQQIIDEKARTSPDVKALESQMLRHSGNIRTKEGAEAAVIRDLVRNQIREAPASEKRIFLLWLFGLGEKPVVVKALEAKYGVRLDGLRATYAQRTGDHYRDAGRGAREEFLKSMMYGENGLLVVDDEREKFLDALFDGVIPAAASSGPQMRALLRESFMSVFKHSDQYQREETLLALLENLSASPDGSRPQMTETTGAKVFLESLGLTGVKVGQFIASSGYASPELKAALDDLKDRARPIYKGIVFAMVEKLAAKFGSRPVEIQELLGSASVKVVYKVLLANGRVAVLKVKRPDVAKKIKADMALLRKIFSDIRPAMDAAGVKLPDTVIDTIEAGIVRELDFDREVQNQFDIDANMRSRRLPLLQRLIAFFAGRGWTRILIADPNETKVVGADIIVETFVPGTALKDEAKLKAAGHNVARIKRDLALELFRQIFIDGKYHADLHGANVRITPGGRAYLIDLGAVEEISLANRRVLFNLIRSMASGNADRAMEILKGLSPADGALLDSQVGEIRKIAASSKNPAEKVFAVWSALLRGGVSIPSELLAVNVALGKSAYLFENLGAGTGAALMLTRPTPLERGNGFSRFLRRIGVTAFALYFFFGLLQSASAATAPVATAAVATPAPAAAGLALPLLGGSLLFTAGALVLAAVALVGLVLIVRALLKARARASSAEEEMGRRLFEQVKARADRPDKVSEAQVMTAFLSILSDGTSPAVGVGRTTQASRPLAEFNPMKVAVAVAAQLKGSRLNRSQVGPALELLAALLANGSSARRNIVKLDEVSLLRTLTASPESDAVHTPTDVAQWLDPALGKAAADAVKTFAEWRSQEHAAEDQLALIVPTDQMDEVTAAIRAAGGEGIVQLLDAAKQGDALALLRNLHKGKDVEKLVGTRKFRFLVRNDIGMPPGFFDFVAAGLAPRLADSLRSEMEVYLILSAISQAIRIEPDMLSAFETMRTVMIQA